MSDYSAGYRKNAATPTVKETVATLAADVQKDGAQVAKAVKDAAQGKLDEAGACATACVDGVKKQADGLKQHLTDKPLQTVALAFVAGAFLTALLGRR